MELSRRKFLLNTLGAGSALALMDVLRIAKASNRIPPVTDRYFVFANFLGGWDAI